MVTSEGAIDYFGVGKRHAAVSDLALLSMVISSEHYPNGATGIDIEPLNCFFEARLTPNLLL
jgi:hypothetical protein